MSTAPRLLAWSARFVAYWAMALAAQLPASGPVDSKALSGAALGAAAATAEHFAPTILRRVLGGGG